MILRGDCPRVIAGAGNTGARQHIRAMLLGNNWGSKGVKIW